MAVVRELPAAPFFRRWRRVDEMSKGKVVRCKACGRPINGHHKNGCEEESAVRIEIGDVNGDDGVVEFHGMKPWGYMHRRCFLLSIGAPVV